LDKFQRIIKGLDIMQAEFNAQLYTMDSDTNDFHKQIIKLAGKHPDHAELLEFMVFVNDKLETKHNIFTDIMTDSFNDLLNNKRMLIDEIIVKSEPQKSPFSQVKDTLTNPKELKFYGLLLAIILVAGTVLFQPKAVMDVTTRIIGAKK
jgi:hypothetical protein